MKTYMELKNKDSGLLEMMGVSGHVGKEDNWNDKDQMLYK